MEFHTPLEGESIRNFEKNNNIGVAIYVAEKNEEGENIVIRKRSPSRRFGQVSNIFLMTILQDSKTIYHFCAISRLSALIKSQGRKNGASYCSYCSVRFFDKFEREKKADGCKGQKVIGVAKTHKELCTKHEKVCQVITGELFTPREVLPEARDDKNILRFKKWGHLFRAAMHIYSDLECALVNCYEPGTEGSMVYHKHKPIACSLRVVSDIPNFVIPKFNYRGPDAHLRLVKRLKALAQ